MTSNVGINLTLQMTGPGDPKQARAFAAAVAEPLMAEIAKRVGQAVFNTVAPR